MPRRDGTGPWGAGPMTGRGFGPCCAGMGFGRGQGRAFRRGPGYGYGYGYGYEPISTSTRKEFLQEQKKLLKDQLSWIDEELKGD